MVAFVAGQKVRASDLNGGLPQLARVTSDVAVISTTSYVDVTGLVLPMEANSVYALDGFLKYTSATAADIKFVLIGPTGSGGSFGVHGVVQAATATTGDFEAFCLDGIGIANQIGLGGAGVSTSAWGHLKGYITTGVNAGTLQVQFTQVTSTASNTTVKTGSNMTLTKIA
jgi:hypothetical protein